LNSLFRLNHGESDFLKFCIGLDLWITTSAAPPRKDVIEWMWIPKPGRSLPVCLRREQANANEREAIQQRYWQSADGHGPLGFAVMGSQIDISNARWLASSAVKFFQI